MNILAFILMIISLLLTVLMTISFFALKEEDEASWASLAVVVVWWIATAIVQGLFV